MDFFDFPAPDIPGPGAGRPAGDNVAYLLALIVFPVLDFLLVAEWLDPKTGFELAGVVLPGGFATLTYAAGRTIGGRPWFLVGMALLCFGTCFLASGVGAFFALF